MGCVLTLVSVGIELNHGTAGAGELLEENPHTGGVRSVVSVVVSVNVKKNTESFSEIKIKKFL